MSTYNPVYDLKISSKMQSIKHKQLNPPVLQPIIEQIDIHTKYLTVLVTVINQD